MQRRSQPAEQNAGSNAAPEGKSAPPSNGIRNTLCLLVPSLRGTILVLGIYVFFVAFGYYQETVFQVGDKALSDTFRYPIFLVSLLCLGNVFISFVILNIEFRTKLHPDIDPPEIDDVGERHHLRSPITATSNLSANKAVLGLPNFLRFFRHYLFDVEKFALREIALSSVTYVVSMLCTNYALTHVNYPTQVLVKSAKCVPVILGGFLFFGKRYPLYDYVSVAAITISLAIFNMSRGSAKNTHQTITGLILLGLSLFCDSLTGPRQDRLLGRVKLSSNHLMFVTNVFGTLIAFAACLLIEGAEPIWFCQRYPEAIRYYIPLYCLSAALGQLFIFASLTAFGSLQLTLITTTRKFFTVLLSVVLFAHPVTRLQWSCVVVIFGSLMVQSFLTKRRKRMALTTTQGLKRD